MFNVTAGALDRLSRKLVGKKAADDVSLRFTHQDGGWFLGTDRQRDADLVFTHGGRNVLVLDDAASRAMMDMTLDVQDTDSGPRLKLCKSTNDED